MHLSSITIKGFKSFPERTSLVFSPGVSVIVGPNGCGKSNVTDAVLWALGEQSPLSVRGQTMQDMIYAGGEGVGPSRYAEVEVVLDSDDDGTFGAPGTPTGEAEDVAGFSSISIARRLERGGEGSYRINGARARLADVIEILADANLGREMHSVISQGRVEEIVLSAPRDRRLLVEEAAGLGKHRKRRRRAQLKLEPAGDGDRRNAGHVLGFACGRAGSSEGPVVVGVEHHLDLGVTARTDPLAAGVDHVLHRLPANAERALLA